MLYLRWGGNIEGLCNTNLSVEASCPYLQINQWQQLEPDF